MTSLGGYLRLASLGRDVESVENRGTRADWVSMTRGEGSTPRVISGLSVRSHLPPTAHRPLQGAGACSTGS